MAIYIYILNIVQQEIVLGIENLGNNNWEK